MSFFLGVLLLLIGLLAGVLCGLAWSRRERETLTVGLDSGEQERALLRDGLDRLAGSLQQLQHQGVQWQSQLREQVHGVQRSSELLQREAQSLATALRKPQVRGRWGEMHLRRCVELVGMSQHCDFTEQRRIDGADGALIPDLVVHLSGGRHVVVDSKVSLEAFLDATGATNEPERARHLARHAKQVRSHVDTLSSKRYWQALEATPEFVVLFLPGEATLSAALEADPGLLEHALGRRIVLATPSNLAALLRTIAMGWQHESLTQQTEEIHRLGRELHERLGVTGRHLEKLGRSLNTAVGAFNSAVGSFETRALVSARRFTELGVSGEELPRPAPLTDSARALTASEVLDAVADSRPELDFADPPRPTGEPARHADSA